MGGYFLFDVFFPQNCPNDPPHMNMASDKGWTSAYRQVVLQGACQASHLLGSSQNMRGLFS